MLVGLHAQACSNPASAQNAKESASDLGARDMTKRSELQQQALPPGKQAAPFHLVIPRVFVSLDVVFAARCKPGPQSCPTLAAGSCVKLARHSGAFPAQAVN